MAAVAGLTLGTWPTALSTKQSTATPPVSDPQPELSGEAEGAWRAECR